jgi:hypothetical protein
MLSADIPKIWNDGTPVEEYISLLLNIKYWYDRQLSEDEKLLEAGICSICGLYTQDDKENPRLYACHRSCKHGCKDGSCKGHK